MATQAMTRGSPLFPFRKDALVAQTRNSQRTPPSRGGLNREQTRRGLGGAPNPGPGSGRPSTVGALAGGRANANRRGNPLTFLRETRAELRKVVWPTPRETRNLTIVVLALSVVVGLFLGAFDFIFQELFRWLLSLTGGGY
jgi:preprotein translocase subunit SecE